MSTEAQRLDYPLGEQSLVLDLGAYVGNFSRHVVEKFGCTSLAFEPMPQAFAQLPEAWKNEASRITAYEYGVGAKTERVRMAFSNDSSSQFMPSTDADPEVLIRDVVEVFNELDIGNVDLMKINIEGGEYALLERMDEAGLIDHVRFLQIQFHSYGAGPKGCVARRLAVREMLDKTHREQWCWDGSWPGLWTWESWERR